MKKRIKQLIKKLGYNVVHVDRLGIDIELDLARLTDAEPIGTIFDVGGNFGQTAVRFSEAFPSATIFTFEPVLSSYSRLREATTRIGRIKAFNLALGDSAGQIQMNLNASAGSNSLLKSGGMIGSTQVAIERLDAFASDQGIECIDMLKIDVEGYEMQVIRGAGRFLAEERIRFIYAECVFAPEEDTPHTNFFSLHEILTGYGFCFVGYYSESFGLRAGCAMGNVLWALKAKLPTTATGEVRNIF